MTDNKPTLILEDEQYNLLQSAIEYALAELDDKMYEREDDYSAEDISAMEDKRREFDELGDWLKIATGRAFDFDKHFTVIRKADGDPVEAQYPQGEVDNAALHHTWTVLDCDGKLCIAPGFHWVNRVQHILTTERWTDEDETKEWIY